MGTTYAENLCERYQGQLVDLYLGDTNGNQFWAEFEKTRLSFLRGRVVAAHGDLLIMECRVLTDIEAHTFEVAINGYNVKMCTPLDDHSPKFNITRLLLDNQSTSVAAGMHGVGPGNTTY